MVLTNFPGPGFMGVADYLQRRYEVTPGNWGDQGHGVEILEVDVFVTRDRIFTKVHGDLATHLEIGAKVLFVNSRDPVLSQLEAGVAG